LSGLSQIDRAAGADQVSRAAGGLTGVKTMKSIAFIIASAIAAIAGVSSASAQSVPWSGSYQVSNNASEPVVQTVVTFPAGVLSGANGTIASNSQTFLSLSNFSTTGTVFSNSFTYENQAKTKGCIFTTLGIYNRRTARYSYTFSASALNSGGGTPPTCTPSNNGVNTSTGVFSALATISGF
jgi:hypothetical protein